MLSSLLKPIAALAIAAGLISIVLLALGASPVGVFSALWAGAFGNWLAFTDTCVKATPLVFTGLAVALSFQGAMWNIGADGQLTIGALLAGAVGPSLGMLPHPIAIALILAAGAIGGAAWGGICGWLRARRNVNEVISTIMLNFVAVQLLSWAVHGPLMEASRAYPASTPIAQSAQLDLFFAPSRLNSGMLLAVALAIASSALLFRTEIGFQLRAAGINRRASAFFGIPIARLAIAGDGAQRRAGRPGRRGANRRDHPSAVREDLARMGLRGDRGRAAGAPQPDRPVVYRAAVRRARQRLAGDAACRGRVAGAGAGDPGDGDPDPARLRHDPVLAADRRDRDQTQRGRPGARSAVRSGTPPMLEAFLSSTISMATPILLAALGELLVEESGVLNIGIEGAMLCGAFAALATAYFSGSVGLGLLAGIAAGVSINATLALLAVNLAVNQVVAGTALDILALGITGVFYRRMFGITGKAFTVQALAPLPLGPLARIPVVGPALFDQNVIVYAAFAIVPILAWLLSQTRYGLELRAAGENPQAADALGLGVRRLRWHALLVSGVLTGLSGAYLTLAYTNTFVEGISAGRGFVALAVVILGRWNPIGLAAASILFGAAMALQFGLQALGTAVPYQLFLALPYALTLAVLAGVGGQAQAPSALGEPYVRS